MRLEQLEYIYDIAKTGSITNSSERFNISQPSMSIAISSLEKELGIKIFKRSRSGTQPTELGKELIEKAQEILKKVDEFKEIGSNQMSLVTGHLSIGASPTIWLTLLPKTLTLFKNKYPGVEFSVSSDDSPILRKKVLDGELDMGIITHISDYVEKNKNLNSRRVLSSKMMLCVGQSSPLANKSSITLDEAFDYPLISNSPQFREWLSQFDKPHFLFKSNHLEARHNIIAEGLAVGFYPDIYLKGNYYVQAGLLKPIEIVDDNMKELSFSLIKLKTHRSIASQQFIKEFDKQLALFQNLWS